MHVLLIAIFVIGYLAIVLEHTLGLNKAAAALLTGVLCWTVYIARAEPGHVNRELVHHLGDISQVLFFLLAAMTIVEVIDVHDGFEVITSRITMTSRRKLLVAVAGLSFVLSAVLDNLTTSIVMVSLVRRLVTDREDRMYYDGVVIIAANAGGVWSPIGDVTTTMLWVGNQVTTTKLITYLSLPSLVSVVIPLLWLGLRLKGDVRRPGRRTSGASAPSPGGPGSSSAVAGVTIADDSAAVGKTLAELNLRARTGAIVLTITRGGDAVTPAPGDPLQEGDVLVLSGDEGATSAALALLIDGEAPKQATAHERQIVLFAGTTILILVPVFKSVTHLPPVMGILLGLGALWLVTEFLHKRKDDGRRGALTVSGALHRVDAASVLFFLGILLAISALESDGLLAALAGWMDRTVGNIHAITLLIGLSSSVVDNVPLVAASQGMYSLARFPTDDRFWLFLAYCAGTGGSILIIGSAAGVAVMGIERVSFGWYFRKLSIPALLGYAAGAVTYLALVAIVG